MKEIYKVNEAVEYIKSNYGSFDTDTSIVIDSGILDYEIIYKIPYNEIPHFPSESFSGITGNLIYADYKGKKVVIMSGRFHLYEGYSPIELVRPIRILKGLGIKKLIMTNWAGAVNVEYEPGDIMMVIDHVNFGGDNPLTGPDAADFGPVFPILNNAYSERLQEVFRNTAITLDIPLNEGIYIKFFGPSYETPAEVRIARTTFADAIGMGLVCETIAAVQCGLEVAGISCITNMAAGIGEPDNNKAVTIESCKNRLAALLAGAIGQI
jgi:purine-nucleoside phosphorylase